jgi:phytoene/squalene synthetase
VADRDIKLDAAQTLGIVNQIADTVREVAVPGRVPEATGDTPVDQALAAVAKAQQAQSEAWAETLAATIDEQQAKSINAVHMLEATEQDNAAAIGSLYPESGGAGM